MARKNALISLANDNGTLTFTVGEAGNFTVTPADLPDDIRSHAMLHGIVQKISDAAAMPKSELDGKTPEAIAAMKLEAMRSVAERLASGEWSKRSGDGSGPVQGVIYRAFEEWAFAAKKVKTPTDEQRKIVRDRYDTMSRAEQLALRNVPAIAKIIDRIKSERGSAGSTVDTESLLGELGL